jgi:hypothetical protein
MRKVWKEIQSGREWIVDADLKTFSGPVDRKASNAGGSANSGRPVLRLIRAMLKAGSYGKGGSFPVSAGPRRVRWSRLCWAIFS